MQKNVEHRKVALSTISCSVHLRFGRLCMRCAGEFLRESGGGRIPDEHVGEHCRRLPPVAETAAARTTCAADWAPRVPAEGQRQPRPRAPLRSPTPIQEPWRARCSLWEPYQGQRSRDADGSSLHAAAVHGVGLPSARGRAVSRSRTSAAASYDAARGLAGQVLV